MACLAPKRLGQTTMIQRAGDVAEAREKVLGSLLCRRASSVQLEASPLWLGQKQRRQDKRCRKGCSRELRRLVCGETESRPEGEGDKFGEVGGRDSVAGGIRDSDSVAELRESGNQPALPGLRELNSS